MSSENISFLHIKNELFYVRDMNHVKKEGKILRKKVAYLAAFMNVLNMKLINSF